MARIAARKMRTKGLKVIYMAHGFHFYRGAPILNWLLYYPIEKALSKYTDAIITINQEDFRNASERLLCKTIFIVNGIGLDLSRFYAPKSSSLRAEYRSELGIPQDAVVMIYLAELIENKNQTLLMDALKILRDNGKNVYLLLAGSPTSTFSLVLILTNDLISLLLAFIVTSTWEAKAWLEVSNVNVMMHSKNFFIMKLIKS